MHAIGSSYLFRQAPGAERVGGCTIKIRPTRGSAGKLKVVATHWRTDELIDDIHDIQSLIDGATEGVRQFAADNSIDLDDWDVTISRFANHPVDSGPLTFQIAAYNAFASALAAWRSSFLQPVQSGSPKG